MEGRQSMNVQLRKRHQKIWMALLLGVGTLMIIGLTNIPTNPIADIPINYCPEGISSCTLGVHNKVYSGEGVQFMFDASKLTLDLKVPLVSAFTLVYASNGTEKTDQSKLIGQVSEMRLYEFDVDPKLIQGLDHILLYDGLNQHTIYQTKIASIR